MWNACVIVGCKTSPRVIKILWNITEDMSSVSSVAAAVLTGKFQMIQVLWDEITRKVDLNADLDTRCRTEELSHRKIRANRQKEKSDVMKTEHKTGNS